MARFERASGRRGPKPLRRASSPERSATATATPAPKAAGGYASYEDYQKAFREAHAAKDPAKIAEVTDKLRRSPWARSRGA